jgi:uncharacterized radical SAM superfamily protein
MLPANKPDELVNLCRRLKDAGAVGCLISGGCNLEGEVPLDGFLEALSIIKNELKMLIVVHTGVMKDRHVAEGLKKVNVDGVLIDILGSDDTIREVYHLDLAVKDYEASLRVLHDAGVRLMPHVLIGVHYGKLWGEFEALRLISQYQPRAVILIVLTPLRGTPMAEVTPPEPEDVARVMMYARAVLPLTPLVLGCVRPLGEHRVTTDRLAVLAGVNAVVFPTEEAVTLAKTLGLETFFSPVCCSQVYEDVLTKGLRR